MRSLVVLLSSVLLAGCAADPRYLEAYGQLGSGELIQFNETSTLFVGADADGHEIALVRAVDPTRPPFMGMAVQVDLTEIAAPGVYTCNHSGGPAQIRIIVPGDPPLDTVEYTADGTLDILELPVGGNNRFAGSFSGVRVDYDGLDVTIDSGAFRGQL